jgi:hypothetical protein
LVELLVGRGVDGLARVVFSEETEERSPDLFDRGRVGLDFHPVDDRSIAGCRVPIPPLQLDDT